MTEEIKYPMSKKIKSSVTKSIEQSTEDHNKLNPFKIDLVW